MSKQGKQTKCEIQTGNELHMIILREGLTPEINTKCHDLVQKHPLVSKIKQPPFLTCEVLHTGTWWLWGLNRKRGARRPAHLLPTHRLLLASGWHSGWRSQRCLMALAQERHCSFASVLRPRGCREARTCSEVPRIRQSVQSENVAATPIFRVQRDRMSLAGATMQECKVCAQCRVEGGVV